MKKEKAASLSLEINQCRLSVSADTSLQSGDRPPNSRMEIGDWPGDISLQFAAQKRFLYKHVPESTFLHVYLGLY